MNAKIAEIRDIMAYYQTLQPVIGWEWYPALGSDSQNCSTEAMFTRQAGCYLHLMVDLHLSSMHGYLWRAVKQLEIQAQYLSIQVFKLYIMLLFYMPA